jgi:hypothetical protein
MRSCLAWLMEREAKVPLSDAHATFPFLGATRGATCPGPFSRPSLSLVCTAPESKWSPLRRGIPSVGPHGRAIHRALPPRHLAIHSYRPSDGVLSANWHFLWGDFAENLRTENVLNLLEYCNYCTVNIVS